MDKHGKGSMPSDVRDAMVERMMRQYGTAVYRMCFMYLHEKTLAEDAGQETFIKAYRNLESFAGLHENSEKAWLMRIAINTSKDMRRSRWFRGLSQRVALDEMPEIAAGAGPEDRMITQEVMDLPDKYKDVVLLHFYVGLTYDEIGEALAIGKTAVYQRMQKAKQLLRMTLEGGCEHGTPRVEARD